jgi:hypothetical protein
MRRFKNNYTQRKQLEEEQDEAKRLRKPPKPAARMPNPAE